MRTVSWKEARDRGLNILRRRDARAVAHRTGQVFFLELFVQYDSGDLGWCRKQRYSAAGAPFTVKFGTLAEAELAAADERRSITVDNAMDILSSIGLQSDRRRLWQLAISGSFHDGSSLAAAFERMEPVIETALSEIKKLDLDATLEPSRADLRDAYCRGSVNSGNLVAGCIRSSAAREHKRRSEQLKEQKRIERAERLQREYEFLIEQAEIRWKEGKKPLAPERSELILDGRQTGSECSRILDTIYAELVVRPYLRHILTEGVMETRLWVSGDGLTWSEWGPYERWERKRLIARRARAADGFGVNPMEHWGKLKARLLGQLKPQALAIQHNRFIQVCLEEATVRGLRFVVIGKQGYWFDDVASVWELRDFELPRIGAGKTGGDRRWSIGRIISINYGRIIVLPYIKADGTVIEGYTRNAPHEGCAEPRAMPLEIPFGVYDALGRDDMWDHWGNIILADKGDTT